MPSEQRALRVAVSGSTGLVGTALARSLRADGHRLIRLLRPETARDGMEDDPITWDPATGRLDPAAFDGIDAVVHLAGAGIGDRRWTEDRKRVLRDSRVQGTSLLAGALGSLDQPPPVLVSASAIGWYGDRGDELLTEASDPGTGFLAGLCRDWEAATRPAVDAGIRVPRMRTGIVLALDGGTLAKLLPLFRLGLGGRLGSGRQHMSWITIDDTVAAIRWLLDHEIDGPVNLTTPEPVTNAAFTKALGRALGRPTVLPVPSLGPRLLFGKEMVEEAILASQRVLPRVLEESGFSFRHPTIDRALGALLRPEVA